MRKIKFAVTTALFSMMAWMAWGQTPFPPTTATGSPTETYGANWGTPDFGASVSGGSWITLNANDPLKAYVTGSAVGTGTSTFGTNLMGTNPLGAYSSAASSSITTGAAYGKEAWLNAGGTAAQSNGAQFTANPGSDPTSSASAWNTTTGGFNLSASGAGPLQATGGASGTGNSNALATQTANSATGNFFTTGQSNGNLAGVPGGNVYANGQGYGMTQTALGTLPAAGSIITAPYAISSATGGATYTTPATVGPTASGVVTINGSSTTATFTPTSVSATATVTASGAITTPKGH